MSGRPPDDARIEQVRRQAIHLTTVEAGHGFGDLDPLKHMVGEARIVALGEATHGTREFFQLKHRLVEFLVAECGFTTSAIEANGPECEAVDAYVRTGKGDPAAALAGLRFWTWDTEEVLALIRWMRSWNAAHEPVRQVRFTGIDAQFPDLPAARLRAYLAAVDAAWLESISAVLDEIAGLDPWGERGDEAAERVQSQVIGAIADRLVNQKETYLARSSPEAWRTAADQVRILRQIDALRQGGSTAAGFNARDRAMADNVETLIERGGAGAKAIVWAHNGHVTRDSRNMFHPDLRTMGEILAARRGARYLTIGFLFGVGAFGAIVEDGSGEWTLREVTLGNPPEGSLDEALLAAAQSPAFLLDTRHRAGALAQWLDESHVSRETGAVFTTEDEMRVEFIPAARYDVLAFVPRTSRARPTATGHRPRRE